jgi:hypothetical protein
MQTGERSRIGGSAGPYLSNSNRFERIQGWEDPGIRPDVDRRCQDSKAMGKRNRRSVIDAHRPGEGGAWNQACSNGLSDMAMDFDKLYAEALNAWPPEVRLPVRSFMTGHLVDGLTDLEHAIAAQWAGGPLGIVMVTLNWAILRAVHAEFATRQTVVMAELPSVRQRFETELRLLLNGPYCEEPDRAIIREYFGA